MMKFFRKYNKALLAVFMVGLMIVFLGGTALDTLLRPTGDYVVGQSALGPVMYTDQMRVSEITKILGALQQDWRYPIPGVTEPLTELDWVLLKREADRLGVGESFAYARGSNIDWESLNQQAMILRINPQFILEATAEFSAIRQAAHTVGAAAAPSEAEVLAGTRRAVDKVLLRAVMLPASAFVSPDSSIPESEINAHFEAHREHEPGPGLSFGYFVPPQVKVQYLKVSRDALTPHVRVANLEKKAKTLYDENRDKHPAFRRPAKAQPAGEAAEVPKLDEPPYLTWEEAKEKAIELVKTRAAAEAADRIVNWFIQYTTAAWLDLERGKDGYKAAPPETAKPEYYQELISKIPAEMSYPQAVSVGVTDFFSEKNVGKLGPLGFASYYPERGGMPESLASLSFRSQPMVAKVPGERGANPGDYLAQFQTCRFPLTDADANQYVFRVVEGRPAHNPESVGEVHDQVLADLRTLKGYQAAKSWGEALLDCDPSLTLEQAYHQDEELAGILKKVGGGGYLDPPPFARATGYESSWNATTTVTVGGGIGSLPLPVVEECFALEDSPRKLQLFELKDRPALLVVEWVETQRGNTAEYEQKRTLVVQQLTRARILAAASDWLKPDNIRARNQFKFAASQ